MHTNNAAWAAIEQARAAMGPARRLFEKIERSPAAAMIERARSLGAGLDQHPAILQHAAFMAKLAEAGPEIEIIPFPYPENPNV